MLWKEIFFKGKEEDFFWMVGSRDTNDSYSGHIHGPVTPAFAFFHGQRSYRPFAIFTGRREYKHIYDNKKIA